MSQRNFFSFHFLNDSLLPFPKARSSCRVSWWCTSTYAYPASLRIGTMIWCKLKFTRWVMFVRSRLTNNAGVELSVESRTKFNFCLQIIAHSESKSLAVGIRRAVKMNDLNMKWSFIHKISSSYLPRHKLFSKCEKLSIVSKSTKLLRLRLRKSTKNFLFDLHEIFWMFYRKGLAEDRLRECLSVISRKGWINSFFEEFPS